MWLNTIRGVKSFVCIKSFEKIKHSITFRDNNTCKNIINLNPSNDLHRPGIVYWDILRLLILLVWLSDKIPRMESDKLIGEISHTEKHNLQWWWWKIFFEKDLLDILFSALVLEQSIQFPWFEGTSSSICSPRSVIL